MKVSKHKSRVMYTVLRYTASWNSLCSATVAVNSGYVYISRDASQQQNCSSVLLNACHRDFEIKQAVQLSLPFMQSSLAFLNYFQLFSFHIFSTFCLSSSAFQGRVNRLVTNLSFEARNLTHVCMWDLWWTQ